MAEKIKNLILKTENISWKLLKPFQPESLKKTSPERLQKLKKSLVNNGFAMNFYVFEDVEKNIWILDGHHRLKALEELERNGKEVPSKFPCSFLDVRNKTHAKKLVLAFNSHYAELQRDGLFDFIADIDFDDVKDEFEFFDLGFDLPDNREAVEEDELPEVPEAPVSQMGDLYELRSGDLTHRIICGDCTDENVIDRLMDGKRVDMVFTDPPYDKPAESLFQIIDKFILNASIFIMYNFENTKKLIIKYNTPSLFVVNKLWAQSLYNSPMSQIDYISRIGCNKFKNLKDRFTDYHEVRITHFKKNKFHVHEKPVSIAYTFIEHYSQASNTIFDGFLGSGSTLIACQQTGRQCYGIEISPHYVDVIIQRYANYCVENNHKYSISKNGEDITDSFNNS